MELKEKSVVELRNLAKELEISNISKLKKSELIISIEEALNNKNNVEEKKEKVSR